MHGGGGGGDGGGGGRAIRGNSNETSNIYSYT